MTSIQRHQQEILKNKELLEKKPILKEIYRGFYQEISNQLPESLKGLIVELGSGVADITVEIPGCIRTDLFPNPWIDQVENAYSLSFSDKSVAAIILFDVFHHLRYPGTALKEFYRVLAPGGRLIIFDPGYSLLGRLVYGLFHPEPLGLKELISWEAPRGWTGDQIEYYAAQGNAQRIFLHNEIDLDRDIWRKVAIKRLAAFSYVASGGYSKPQLYPEFLLPFMQSIDKLLTLFPGIFATRLLVVLEKVGIDIDSQLTKET
jgi:SAM-dependent methyltransferase